MAEHSGRLIVEADRLAKAYFKGDRSSLRALFGRPPFRKQRVAGMSFGGEQARIELEDGGRSEWFWALREVSFQIREGERVGLIGHNGAGKTTLGRLLARITQPTSGRLHVHGKLCPILARETPAPLLSGRENIYLLGALLGFGSAEVRRCFEAIVDLAGIENFLDMPGQYYSVGMQMRLVVATSVVLPSALWIADEILAVGDVTFRRKSMAYIEQQLRKGQGLILVSHDAQHILRYCERALWFDQGFLCMDGRVEEVVEAYLGRMRSGDTGASLGELDRSGKGSLRLKRVVFDGEKQIRAGAPMGINLDYVVNHHAGHELFLRVLVRDLQGNCLTSFSSKRLPLNGTKSARAHCLVEALPLKAGEYILDVETSIDGELVDACEQAATLHVLGGAEERSPWGQEGIFLTPTRWRIHEVLT